GAYQAAWTITGNSSYIALGGEFIAVNGQPQQGLTRFAIRSKAPNKVGPTAYPGDYAIAASPATKAGASTVRVYATSDMDNGTLTYRVYRHGSTKLLASKTVTSRFWENTSWTFTDTGVAPGTMDSYDLTVTDPFGNTLRVNRADVVDDTNPNIIYRGSTWVDSQNHDYSFRDFGRGTHHASADGASATYSFYGSGISLLTEEGPYSGAITITLDGKQYRVSAYRTGVNRYFEQPVFAIDGLGAGKHTITVTKSGGDYLYIDAFAVR
ncbi:MAG TPA: hypothetical protein VFQ70_01565, partial [Candidatus Saccharimonadaceae bacterium]|nr:hypothetical protein [Candidatus Saccharimonadaceae bacterium]